MTAYLAGLGTAVPPMTINRQEALHVATCLSGPYLTDTDWLPNVYEQCGVQNRHMALGRPLLEDVLAGTRTSGSPFLPGSQGGPTTAERMAIYAREAPPLAVEAAEAALEAAMIRREDITHLVTVSCTGFLAPGIDAILIRTLELSADVQRTHVGFMGCHGAINGLRVAAAIATADRNAVVLLVAVELCSLHYYYGADPSKVIANALFADGAAAVVITGQQTGLRILATGSHLMPDSEREMAWVIGNHGFTMTLTKQIPKLICARLRSWLEPWLARHGYPLEAIREWAVHPGGPKILDAVQQALTLSDRALTDSRDVLKDFGNMSSPTLLFILQRMRGRPESGITVLLGFGPGLVTEAVLLGE
ncbi:type III polyketide synthase [soil metagenome]